MTEPILSIRDLSVRFATAGGELEAVRSVDLDVRAGETVAIVGESGSGKSTLAASVNRLLAANARIVAGSIRFLGRELTSLSEREMTAIRGAGIGLVPQDPMSNLDPVLRIGDQIVEALEVHGASRSAARRRALELLELVGIRDAEERYRQYPHEFSGGMRQRVLIAIGLASRPQLLIADEPTSALDVTVQRRVLDQLGELAADLGTAVLLITHDLALAAERADRVIVMYRGEIVETGEAARILRAPEHEYTRRLVAAAPSLASARAVEAPAADERPALVSVRGVRKRFALRGRGIGGAGWLTAVDGVSFDIPRGRTVAIVGESGSGKSTVAKMLLRLEQPDAGEIVVDHVEAHAGRAREALAFRRKVQPVFQNPFSSLDPRYTVGRSIEEPLRVHRVGDAARRRARVDEVLEQVALPAGTRDRLPHELSGGQRQRVAIARALALAPQLIVLDEAVSALDVLVQAQILELLVGLQRELDLSYLFISHDLAVVRMIAHEVHVMSRGRVVESGTPERIFAEPEDPYTRELLAAIPAPR